MTDLASLLADRGIYCSADSGTHRTACPRKCGKDPRKDTALSVTIDANSAVWNCFRCGEKGSIGHTNGARYNHDKAASHETVAATAREIWAKAQYANSAHGYLKKKGVGAHNLKVDHDGRLLVPLYDIDGNLWNLQTIAPDGSKRFLKGGRVKGLLHILGDRDPGAPGLVICEGLATAASIREACNTLQCAIAFNAGNLAPVARALRQSWPAARIVIAADDDHATEGNPGLTAARAAADLVGAAVAVPELPDGNDGTDFNDMRGYDRINEIIWHAMDNAPEPRQPPPSEARINIIRPIDWQGQPVPERKWHVTDWIPDRHVTALYGNGGAGKSLLAQQLLTATAIGRPWLGLETKKCRAIGFFCEDLDDELHIRQEAINQMYGCDYHHLGNLEITSRVNLNNILMTFARDGEGQASELLDELLRWAKDFQAEFVLVDTAADTFGGNENVRTEVRLFIQTCLGRIAREINGAVLLNAHPSRAGMSTGDGGSTGWNNSVRSRLHLYAPKPEDEAEPDSNVRVLERPKANYAASGDCLRLRWLAGTLQVDPRVDGATSGQLGNIERTRADALFLELLNRAISEDGRRLSPSPNAGSYAPKLMARMDGRDGFTKTDFQRAMERLFAQRRIKAEPYNRFGSLMIVPCDPPESAPDLAT
jgi:RecA-family ATPase